MEYKLQENWILIIHQDWSELFINENIFLNHILKKINKYEVLKKYTKFKEKNILENFEDIFENNFVSDFFNWFNDKFPNINKISIHERDELLNQYKFENNIDNNISIEYFNYFLPKNIINKKISIRWKTTHWYFINKKTYWFYPYFSTPYIFER